MHIKSNPNEKQLLEKIALGDEYAFSELFNWYYQPLGSAIINLTESLPITEEIVQDTFVKIWLKREMLLQLDDFKAYLFIMCRNHAFAVLKKLAKEKQIQPVLVQNLQWEADFDDLDNPAEHYRHLINDVIIKLPKQQQTIYLLSRQERLKYEEIAIRLNISPETVKTQIYNAVKFIRKELGSTISPSILLVLTSMLANRL